jgi:hypothetical protein
MQKAEPHDAAAPSGVHKTKANESFFIAPPELWTAENCYESSVRKKREGRAEGKMRVARTGAEPHR